ncbi:MAG TPA: TetR/AcrR family transcriptional regulator [Sediminibacterium sp.]|nr:TetR/AcrR family transcriptional regulator [Sediminibacterium sp.]
MSLVIKQEQILDAAIRRLSHFGVNKTSLTEIAEDVHMTKQALMYYYHDKQQLIASVTAKISGEYIETLSGLLDKALPVKEVFLSLIDMRRHFFSKYHLLFIQLSTTDLIGAAEIEQIRKETKDAEAGLLAKQIELFIGKGEIRPNNALDTVTLILDTITSLAIFLGKQCPPPSQAEIDNLIQKQKALVELLFKGLETDKIIYT